MLLAIFLWFLLLCGRVTPEIALFAALTAGAVFAFCCAFLGHSFRREWLCYRLLPFFIGYLFLLLWEILKAALGVLRILWSREKPGAGELVELRSGLHSRLANLLLANSITLTPGTITVHLEGDKLLIHCLTARLAAETDAERMAFLPMLRRLDAILGKSGKEETK